MWQRDWGRVEDCTRSTLIILGWGEAGGFTKGH